MAGPAEIGLKAVFDSGEFNRGVSDYISKVSGAEGTTIGAGQRISTGLSMIGGAVVLGALAAAAAAIGLVTGAAIAAVPAFTDWAEQLDGIGDVLGTTSEESAALAVAIMGVGGNAEAITGQMAFLTRGLVDAKGELGPSGQAMEELGISFRDANGNLLSSTQIIQNVADKVGTMPDGLDKTRVMMKLFGKSGKDMSDALGAMANGGLSEADKKAKELGLSLSGEATDGAIQLNRQFAMLKLTGKGLMVSLGKDLAPAVQDLVTKFSALAKEALPEIKKLIPQITGFFTSMADVLITNIPVAFNAVSDIFNFLINNQWLVIGALAGITAAVAFWAYTTITAAIPAITGFIAAFGPAIAVILLIAAVAGALAWAWENNFLGMRDVLTQFWETSVKPALEQLWNWLQINIPIAIQFLSDLWTNTLLPALVTIGDWITANLVPVLTTLWTWLNTNIPVAIQFLSDLWMNTLLPAITAIWNWINTNLVPVLAALADIINSILIIAIQKLTTAWNTTLLPAMKEIWGFIEDTLGPVIKTLADIFENVLTPAIKSTANQFRLSFEIAINWIADKLQWLADWLQRIADRLRGLWGGDTDSASLNLGTGTGGATNLGSATSAVNLPTSPSANTKTINVTNNFGNNNLNGAVDLALFEASAQRSVELSLSEV